MNTHSRYGHVHSANDLLAQSVDASSRLDVHMDCRAHLAISRTVIHLQAAAARGEALPIIDGLHRHLPSIIVCSPSRLVTLSHCYRGLTCVTADGHARLLSAHCIDLQAIYLARTAVSCSAAHADTAPGSCRVCSRARNVPDCSLRLRASVRRLCADLAALGGVPPARSWLRTRWGLLAETQAPRASSSTAVYTERVMVPVFMLLHWCFCSRACILSSGSLWTKQDRFRRLAQRML